MNVAELLCLPSLPADLARVEEALRAAIASADPLLDQAADHLRAAGGKRLRPLLALAAASAAGAEVSDAVVTGGVAVELIHLGSLYHDDVMDDASTRRGVVSANARWGNLVAILAGDFLMAKASEIAAPLGVEVTELLARTIGRLCEGQVGELQHAFQVARPEAAYLASIGGKTASLMATACRVAGIVSGLPRDQVEALTRFGDAFGMSFQIRDDILDICASDEQLGKPAGNDLVEGVYTLPVIRALALPEVGPELAAILGGPIDAPERDKAREIVRSSGAVPGAVDTARAYADTAASALRPLGERPAALALSRLAHSLLDDLAH